MKRNFRILIIAGFLFAAPMIMLSQPPHPNGGNTPGPNNIPVGGAQGAPISDGEAVLLSLGLVYAAFNLYRIRRTISISE